MSRVRRVRFIYEKYLDHGRMTTLTDTLTVALVLVLLFGSIALYLYTRIQQAEQKISLLEGILLDLKMSSEVKSYSELPAVAQEYAGYAEYVEPDEVVEPSKNVDEVTEPYVPYDESVETPDTVIEVNSKVIYDSMTLKELQNLAKSKEITGIGSMKKGQLIETLKALEKPVEPGSGGSSGSSFIETSIDV